MKVNKTYFSLCLAAALSVSLSGCAQLYLQSAVRTGDLRNTQLDNYSAMRGIGGCSEATSPDCTIDGAIELAFNQADAYGYAANLTQATQDVFSIALLQSAGWIAIGALEEIDDAALAERAIQAAAINQLGNRYTPQQAVTALYTGASRMNCIALAGSLYQEVSLTDFDAANPGEKIPTRLASFVMILAMREVEFRTLSGTARAPDDFSTILTALQSAGTTGGTLEILPEDGAAGGDTEAETAGTDGNKRTETAGENGTTPVLVPNQALQRFFGVISGCLHDATIQPKLEQEPS